MYLLGGCVTQVERHKGTAAESVVCVSVEQPELVAGVGRQSPSVWGCKIGLDIEVH